ncbi:uncharacterized protein MYCFIDRAFT_209298 [Pseudocercospora fijiensis CIRAD86]|uniref:Uncharacterized protein n=1 Tax=Pseudocercospora fijiensis (strain CIRAD86) TaxID=383855 RepID=M3AIH9_PSEFD|nr:uncharacterized protein MYCFIDRAFT_209298 [Pseudocercospora fijiensis CIRAD86]EME77252.1 hypothetical protein MYCFIDRAFT_209298 [Pseudocercospora fijiensis CIRAD86]
MSGKTFLHALVLLAVVVDARPGHLSRDGFHSCFRSSIILAPGLPLGFEEACMQSNGRHVVVKRDATQGQEYTIARASTAYRLIGRMCPAEKSSVCPTSDLSRDVVYRALAPSTLALFLQGTSSEISEVYLWPSSEASNALPTRVSQIATTSSLQQFHSPAFLKQSYQSSSHKLSNDANASYGNRCTGRSKNSEYFCVSSEATGPRQTTVEVEALAITIPNLGVRNVTVNTSQVRLVMEPTIWHPVYGIHIVHCTMYAAFYAAFTAGAAAYRTSSLSQAEVRP